MGFSNIVVGVSNLTYNSLIPHKMLQYSTGKMITANQAGAKIPIFIGNLQKERLELDSSTTEGN